MKSKIFRVLLLLLFITPVAINAQSKKNKNKKTVVVTKGNKRTVVVTKGNKKVSRTKVIYKKPKTKVAAVRALPNKKIIRHKNQNYYYSNNRFYVNSGGRFTRITPRVGFRIQTLPVGHRKVNFNSRLYFFFDGIFYNNVENQYEVIEPEIGTIVYQLPADYERVVIDGQAYYEYANVLYEKVQVNGTRAYEVVGIVDID